MRRSARRPAWAVLLGAITAGAGCGDSTAGQDAPNAGDASIGPRDATIDERWFEEQGEASGLALVRTDAQFEDFHGRMSGGVCLFDFDSDGVLDVLLTAPSSAGGLRLHRGDGAMHFVDRTAESGLAGIDAGGCLTFDLEGDGDGDVVALGFGAVRLLRNDGGVFVDASDRLPAVFDPKSHYMSAVAFDADGDDLLDLAIADYGAYREPPAELDCVVTCQINNGFFHGGSTLLLLQRASGVFDDASFRLGRVDEAGLVLLATDLDENGRLDLFVGNDSPITKDRYWSNGGGGTFLDIAASLGVAVNGRKNGVSSMSTFDADVDGDGHLDLLQSSWEDDRDTLFRCASGKCVDVAEALELFRTPKNLRWGQALADFDDDGVLELLEAVGHVYRASDFLKPGDPRAPVGSVTAPLLLWHRAQNDAPFAMEDASNGLDASTAGRGLVVADLDGDGALDAVVNTALGRPLLLRGVHGPRGHWVGVALTGKGKNSRAIGARVIVRAGGKTFTSLVHAGYGYRSSVDAPLHFGLGGFGRVDIEIVWPSGQHTTRRGDAVDRIVTIAEP